jgi:hypothetical protein
MMVKVDSNTATVSMTVQDTTTCGTNLPISGVAASGNDGNLLQMFLITILLQDGSVTELVNLLPLI